jgi:hypothetical protein
MERLERVVVQTQRTGLLLFLAQSRPQVGEQAEEEVVAQMETVDRAVAVQHLVPLLAELEILLLPTPRKVTMVVVDQVVVLVRAAAAEALLRLAAMAGFLPMVVLVAQEQHLLFLAFQLLMLAAVVVDHTRLVA